MTLDELIQQAIALKNSGVSGDTQVLDYDGHDLTELTYDDLDNAVIID